MSQKVLQRLSALLGSKLLGTSSFRGDDELRVAPSNWREVVRTLRDDEQCAMDHFIDLTAVDYPDREPEVPRFDVILLLRSSTKNHRVKVKTRVRDGEPLDSLVPLFQGANWTEREVWDLFGIRFAGHPDLRRILMYEEFVGHPLRKDYPIKKTQPLVPYRDVPNAKLAPFGEPMGNPFGRVDWLSRLGRRGDVAVSPAIAVQLGERPALSVANEDLDPGAKKN